MNNLKERSEILDRMEQRVGHTAEKGCRPVSRYSRVIEAAEVNNNIIVDAVIKETKKKAEAELMRLKVQHPGKEFDVRRGESTMHDGALMLWFIVSERI